MCVCAPKAPKAMWARRIGVHGPSWGPAGSMWPPWRTHGGPRGSTGALWGPMGPHGGPVVRLLLGGGGCPALSTHGWWVSGPEHLWVMGGGCKAPEHLGVVGGGCCVLRQPTLCTISVALGCEKQRNTAMLAPNACIEICCYASTKRMHRNMLLY